MTSGERAPMRGGLLATYQARLSELLDRGASPAAIRAALLADPELERLYAYVRAMDDRALDVAVKLRRTWGAPTR